MKVKNAQKKYQRLKEEGVTWERPNSDKLDDPTVLTKWKALQSSIRRHGVDATIEEAAYTWFNRLIAIRILSKNGYDPAQLEYEGQGLRLPVILAKARRGMATYLDKEEKARLQLFITDYSQEVKAFSILLTGYCHNHNLLNPKNSSDDCKIGCKVLYLN